MLGTNPREPLLRDDDGKTLDIVSIFATIQGEGPFTGRPATFIRLAGCHLACYFCDTDFLTNRQRMTVEELFDRVVTKESVSTLVVLTGGEPMRQNIVPLCLTLTNAGHTVQIETAGSYWPIGAAGDALARMCRREEVHIVVSPKTGYVHQGIEDNATAWKYIVTKDDPLDENGLPMLGTQRGKNRGDLLTDARPPAHPPRGTRRTDVYLQPCDEGDDEKTANNIRLCVAMCLKHGYRLSLQQHKLLGLP